ncbi:16S rRNA (uracil(1498)-N(3))-methyltransferase [Lachnospiraceae bacterium C1.1]|nr:16S rRNA (uracil(1498)-N(3))-methyltransferase [Lachnospiraceae bacterium C1.1]
MYHFFAEPSNISDNDIYIEGNDYNHIKNVLRMKVGEIISIGDGISDKEYRCHIEDFTENAVHCRLDFIKESGVELPVNVTLYQGLPKSDKMELIIQKCVELGVARIVPVECSRSVVRLDAKKAASKVKRWQGISEAAAKQSKRAFIPEVASPIKFSDALKEASETDIRLIPYELAENFESTREIISKIKEGQSVSIFIGPEGGFSEDEITAALEQGFNSITLGRRILRTETAALVVLSWLIYLFE